MMRRPGKVLDSGRAKTKAIQNPARRLASRRPWIAILLLLLALTGCTAPVQRENLQPTAEPSQTPVSPTASAATEPVPAADSAPPEGLSGDQAAEWLFMLSDGDQVEAQAALEQVIASGDERFIAVLIELMRFAQIGVNRGAGYSVQIEALEELSGQSFGDSWPAWVEWYGGTDLVPPPGFTSWKGKLMARIDPAFADFLRDEYASTIRVEEIQWGGVLVDGIPALDNPAMIPNAQADYLEVEEAVFGLAIGEDVRAYPLRIMDWHEMANDVVGGVPVSLAYCTLCGAGIAFDGRASDGNTYTFGSSGFLFRSNKLMYDRQTGTLWNQLTGEPVLGELVGSGIRLDILPIVLTTWGDWLSQHPDTQVLALDTGYNRPYEPGAAYGDYFSYSGTMFPVWQRSDLLETKDRIFALQLDGIPKAYPVKILAEEQVVNDNIGEVEVVLVATRGQVEVEGSSLRLGVVNYNAGGEVRAYQRAGWIFAAGPDAGTLSDQNGALWQIGEDGLHGPDGEFLPRLGGHLAYWFGWYSFFPKTLVYGVNP